MSNAMEHALEIVKAQAATKAMTPDEISEMIATVSRSISAATDCPVAVQTDENPRSLNDAKRAIREKSVICMECGKSFKVLTKRHLETHDLTAEEYRLKWGYKKGTSLVAKSLARDRKKKMQDMKLWERRVKVIPKSGSKKTSGPVMS